MSIQKIFGAAQDRNKTEIKEGEYFMNSFFNVKYNLPPIKRRNFSKCSKMKQKLLLQNRLLFFYSETSAQKYRKILLLNNCTGIVNPQDSHIYLLIQVAIKQHGSLSMQVVHFIQKNQMVQS